MEKENKKVAIKTEKKGPIKDKILYEFGEIVEGISHELDDRLEMVGTYAEDEVKVVKNKVKKHK